MDITYNKPVNAWIGQSEQPYVAVFTESIDPERCYYTYMLPSGAWVTKTKLHKTHIKKIELLTIH